MYEWTETYIYVPTDYKICRGKAGDVESEVKHYLDIGCGWHLNGELQFIEVEGIEVAAQGLVKMTKKVVTS